MKRLITTDITDAARLPIKKGTLEFLQDAYKDAFESIILAIIKKENYSLANVYVLYGCEVVGTTLTAGAVFFQGEVYTVDQQLGIVGPGYYWHLKIDNYVIDADPVIFTDNASHYVHNIRKLYLNSDSSGGVLYDDRKTPFAKKIYTGSVDLGTNHNIIPTITTLTFEAPMPTSSYTIVGQLRTTTGVDPYNKSAHAYVTNKTANGFQLISYGLTNFTMQLYWDYVLTLNEW